MYIAHDDVVDTGEYNADVSRGYRIIVDTGLFVCLGLKSLL